MIQQRNGYWIPTAIAVGIIPFITRVYCYTNEVLARYPWFMDSSYSSSDVFLAYKSFGLQILMAVMIIVGVVKTARTKERLSFDRSFVLLLIYLLFVLLSGLFSEYPALAFGGSYDRFEPVGAVSAYVIICIYSYYSIDSENELKTILCVSAAFCALMMFGMYISVFFPVCVMAVTLPVKKPIRIFAGILAALSLFVLYKSGSISGWIALAVSAAFTFIIWMISNRKKLIPLMMVIAAITAVVISLFVFSSKNEEKSPGKIADIRTEDDEAVFIFNSGNELHTSFDFTKEGEIVPKFWDKDGNKLAAFCEDGVYRLEECFEYSDAAVKGMPTEEPGIYIASFVIDGHQWPITNCTDGTYYYINSGLKPVKFPKTGSAGIFNDGIMSGRGAIWNRCIPLLKDHLLLGAGSNLFITDYSQEDYVSKTYSMGWGSFAYDVKPHSFYLCTWMENGLLVFVCILVFFILYVIKGTRLYGSIDYTDQNNRFEKRIGLGLYIGCIAYDKTESYTDVDTLLPKVLTESAGFGIIPL